MKTGSSLAWVVWLRCKFSLSPIFTFTLVLVNCYKNFWNIFAKIRKLLGPNSIGNCNRTEWSPIRSVIIRVITKSDDRGAGV